MSTVQSCQTKALLRYKLNKHHGNREKSEASSMATLTTQLGRAYVQQTIILRNLAERVKQTIPSVVVSKLLQVRMDAVDTSVLHNSLILQIEINGYKGTL